MYSDIFCGQTSVPQVLKSCSEFIEKHGVVDGIYRHSGVSSNIQKLRCVCSYFILEVYVKVATDELFLHLKPYFTGN